MKTIDENVKAKLIELDAELVLLKIEQDEIEHDIRLLDEISYIDEVIDIEEHAIDSVNYYKHYT